MKILILSKYSEKGASSRYRLYNYKNYFRNADLDCQFHPLFGNSYIDKLYSQNALLVRLMQIGAVFKRIKFLIVTREKYDLVIVEKELLPNFPYFIERWLLRKRKYALDFDDYIAASYKTHFLKKRFLSSKIERLVKRAEFVTVGNHWYFEEFKNGKIVYLPTVIDLNAYTLIKSEFETEVVRLVWLGSPSTAKYLTHLSGVLKNLSEKYSISLKVIGGQFVSEGIEIEIVQWDSETEAYEIYKADIGIMPLSDSLWEKGKCGFKLIQYMASGLPVVGSFAPANEEIIQHGRNGFLAGSEDEWYASLEKLILNANLRKSLGQEARKTIEARYSYQIWGQVYADLISTTIIERNTIANK